MGKMKQAGHGLISLVLMVAVAGCSKSEPVTKLPIKKEAVAVTKPAVEVPVETDAATDQASSEPLPAGVLAKVGSWTLTTEEFNARIKGVKQVMKDFDENAAGAKATVLDELIRQQLLVNEGRRMNVQQGRDIQAAVKDFENTLVVQEVAGQLVREIKAGEQDAKDYYNSNPDAFVVPVEKRLREIVVPTETEAKEILVQVLQGGDFAAIARERSKGASAARAGDLDYVMKAPFEQMQKEIEPLKKNDVSRVFSGPEGFYVIKVEDLRGGNKKEYFEVRDDLVKWLTMQKQQQAVLEKIGEIAKKIKVQVNVDLIKGWAPAEKN